MGINGISTGYYQVGNINYRTSKPTSETNFLNIVNNNVGNKVVSQSSYVYCHSAHIEVDASLDYDSIMFGTYHEDGSALEIYKSNGYTNENPLVDIYIRKPDGEWSKETINAKDINLEHCSYVEMRAAMAYLRENGTIKDEWISTLLANPNEDQSRIVYDDMFISQNWLDRVERWMKYQIEGGEYAAYKRFSILSSIFKNYMQSVNLD